MTLKEQREAWARECFAFALANDVPLEVTSDALDQIELMYERPSLGFYRKMLPQRPRGEEIELLAEPTE